MEIFEKIVFVLGFIILVIMIGFTVVTLFMCGMECVHGGASASIAEACISWLIGTLLYSGFFYVFCEDRF